MKWRFLFAGLMLVAAAGQAWSKLPTIPVDPAKAAATKAQADETAKKDAALLGKAQDKAVANYRKHKGAKPAVVSRNK